MIGKKKKKMTNLSCRESTRPHWDYGFAFCQTGLELLDLLAVSFDKRVSVDHFLLLCIELTKKKLISNAGHLFDY
jgi:hypothetical protein